MAVITINRLAKTKSLNRVEKNPEGLADTTAVVASGDIDTIKSENPATDMTRPIGKRKRLRKSSATVTYQPRLTADGCPMFLWSTTLQVAANGIWASTDPRDCKIFLAPSHLAQSTWEQWHQRRQFPTVYLAAPSLDLAVDYLVQVNATLADERADINDLVDSISNDPAVTDPPMIYTAWANFEFTKGLTKPQRKAEYAAHKATIYLNRLMWVMQQWVVAAGLETVEPTDRPLIPRLVHKYNPIRGGRKK